MPQQWRSCRCAPSPVPGLGCFTVPHRHYTTQRCSTLPMCVWSGQSQTRARLCHGSKVIYTHLPTARLEETPDHSLFQGVIEFSLCLLFAKLVSYTFLFWLPLYITNVDHLDAKQAGELSTLFDVGGIFGELVKTCSAATRTSRGA
ncbi:hypothetical protein P7K49_032567 [Saguinus oedipus]|uniref:Uncharacterized protein n=1 Tax=Saguinus oedipus TaxID=9490 RepID=A0ABQ9TZA3_SAGOE|nr:hypothetical protein P7K49_032567 [Saguinus oedipus]